MTQTTEESLFDIKPRGPKDWTTGGTAWDENRKPITAIYGPTRKGMQSGERIASRIATSEAKRIVDDYNGLLAHIHTLEEQNGRLRKLLGRCNWSCGNLHHDKADRHAAGELCPVQVRIDAALAPPAPATREMEP